MPTVLIVEDEPDLAQVMALAIGRAGFDVLTVDTGALPERPSAAALSTSS